MSKNVIEFSIKALDNFSANMSKLESGLSNAEKAIAGVAIAGAAFKAIGMARASLDNAEAMGVAAEKANMATEQYSALAWAAKMSNVEQGSLTTGLKMLGKALAEGDASQAGQSLKSLGVAARDASGNMRPTLDVLLDVSDKFKNAAQDANKTKMAMELFGRSGVEMVPMLNQGSGAIKAMMADAEKLGVVISSDFAKSADQINDNLATMSAVIDGSVNVAMKEMAPVMEEMTGRFIEFLTEGDNVKEVGQTITTALRLVMSAGVIVTGVFKTLGDVIGGVAAALVAIASGEFKQAASILEKTYTNAIDNVSESMTSLANVWDESAQSAAASSAKQMTAAMQLNKSLGDTAQARKDSAAAAKIEADAVAAATEIRVQAMVDELNLMERVKEAESEASNTTRVEQLNAYSAAIDSLRTPMDLYLEKVREIQANPFMPDEMKEQQIENANQVMENMRAAVEWYGISVQSVSRGIGDMMAQTIVDGASLAKGMEALAKGVLKTIISTYVQMQAQRLILAMMDKGLTASTSAQKMAAGMGEVFTNSFASAAAIPMVGWAMAPQVAMANTALAMAGASSAMAAGAGLGGIAHGGLDYVPSESTYLLDKGERVLSPRQNTDLTDFLSDGGGGSGVRIESLTIHVLENATNVDAFARMDKIQLRNALGQPVIDALNEMFTVGVRPNFAMQNR